MTILSAAARTPALVAASLALLLGGCAVTESPVDSGQAVLFFCAGAPQAELAVTFFATDPPTLQAQWGEQTAVMQQQASASGARYAGDNVSFWEHQGEATVRWGKDAPAFVCRKTGDPGSI